MMKKLLVIALIALSMASCKSWFDDLNNNDRNRNYRTDTRVEDYRQGTNGQGYYGNDYRGGDYRNGQGVTDYRQGNNGNYQPGYNVPRMGETVTSLGTKNPQRVIVNGETLYVVNGVYYKAVRTASGTVYQVVGYQQR